MSADIVNLRQARKRKDRADKEARAAENRTRFGRKKSDRETETADRERAARILDGKFRERGDPDN